VVAIILSLKKRLATLVDDERREEADDCLFALGRQTIQW